MSRKDTKAVEEWPVPKCTEEVERFLGFLNYVRSFLKDVADLAKPLYGFTGKKQFKWGDREQGAFEERNRTALSWNIDSRGIGL